MKVASQNKYKNWVFTWNENNEGELLPPAQISDFMKIYADYYVFQEECGDLEGRFHYQGAFKTKIRKRQSTIIKEFQENFGDQVLNLTINRMCGTWEESYAYCTKNDTSTTGKIWQSSVLEDYNARDIKIFEDRANWFPWQRTLSDKVFIQNSLTVSTADDREIIWIEDPEGCTGKSKYCKFICSTNNDIIKLPFGTSSQLRSAVISAGRRKLYIIDIPRTVGDDDDLNALISTVEDIKNGYVVSSMYGKYQDLFMEPPHIVIFSNDRAPVLSLSNDRWSLYKITKELTLDSVPTMKEDEWHPMSLYQGADFYEDEEPDYDGA